MFALTHFTLEWHIGGFGKGVGVKEGIFASDSVHAVSISEKKMGALLALAEDERAGRSAVILGSPIINDKVDRKKVAGDLVSAADPENFIKDLNGEFLAFLWDESKGSLHIFTDRQASYPFYWALNGKTLAGSYLYMDVARYCRDWSGFALRPEKAYEFFVLQRLMGSETHDTLTSFLPSGSHLKVTRDGRTELSRYWERGAHKTSQGSRRELGEQFVALFSNAVTRCLTGADASYGVFLSGGHDSRIVAAYADRPVTCYTLGFNNNREVKCARAVAKAIGQDHVFLKLNESYFTDALQQSAYLGGGMYAVDHALFLPVAGSDHPSSDIYLHGHGLDYMYQGMYLHARSRSLAGRTIFRKKFVPFPADLSQHFIQNVSFRLKYRLNEQLIRADKVKKYKQSIYESVSTVERLARDKAFDDSQTWEYLIFHEPSRHYTYTNVLSKRVCGEVRTPSFDNDLYDFYLNLPDQYRLHADMARIAMKNHPARIDMIPAGNYGIPAGWGPWAKTSALILRKILKEVTGASYFSVPGSADRTWPDRTDYMKAQEEYWQAALGPIQDQGFMELLDFIDWQKLKEDPRLILEQEYGASFMVALMSYYLFYQALYQRKELCAELSAAS